jgi:2-(1,2-epoxy-1,2-dihydrophenyl)acetyl-CoA isomerase
MANNFVVNDKHGMVLHITLNRPDKFNSFNREMAMQLLAAFHQAAITPSIRAVLLTGTGKAFCAGQDLGEAVDPSGPGIERIVKEHYNAIILAIRNLEKPVVCAVNGVAAGAGANIALACDVVVAGKSAAFIQAFSKIGLIPDSAGTFFLPKLIGFQRASALMMLGDKVAADEALQLGMLYKVFEDAALIDESMNIATTLAGMPTRGLWLTKKLLNESSANSLNRQLDRECEEQIVAANTADHKEGVQAFLQKRKPEFKGE